MMYIYKDFDISKPINNIDDWFRECPPKQRDKHWKDGRSAKELARYLTKELPNVPFELLEILRKYSTIDNMILAPEFVTNLKSKRFGSGEGRTHDSLVLMRDAVIGIEAKADEGLDRYYSSIVIDDTINHRLRYRGLYKALFGDDDLDGKIRYQLVSASVGTIIEAIERQKQNVVLLIISFLKEGCFDERKVKRNFDDIEYFIHKFVKTKNRSLIAKIASENNINFFIEHLSISL